MKLVIQYGDGREEIVVKDLLMEGDAGYFRPEMGELYNQLICVAIHTEQLRIRESGGHDLYGDFFTPAEHEALGNAEKELESFR